MRGLRVGWTWQNVRAADPERPLLARLAAQARRAWPALELARGLPGGPPASP